MASSPLRSKSHFHVRSISLPSTSHPLIPQINEHLSRVRVSASEATSSSISSRLTGLENLFDCIDDLLQLPKTQQVFSQECHKKLVDEVLDGYLWLLDLCTASKDVLSQTKQDVQELLSILRRKRNESGFEGYLVSRKKSRKVIQKSLKDLKSIKTKQTLQALNINDHKIVPIVSMLNEVSEVTLAVFESLMSYTSGTKLVQSRRLSWSSVSKLIHQKRMESQDLEETDTNEFEKVDAALYWFIGHKTSKSDKNGDLDNVQNQLGKLELSIEDLEEGLECLFRRLIKTRVSLLNILN